MTERAATQAEVIKHYQDRGADVRIDSEGHVEFRPEGEDDWLEGRWVEEYRFDSEIGVRV